jgi:hypothetical protein
MSHRRRQILYRTDLCFFPLPQSLALGAALHAFPPRPTQRIHGVSSSLAVLAAALLVSGAKVSSPTTAEAPSVDGAPATQPAPAVTEAPAAVTTPSPAQARPTTRIAVYAIASHEPADARVAAVLTGSVVAEIRKLDGIIVVGMDELRAMLDHEAQKQLVGCTDDSCLSEIAAALGVDEIVVGSIADVGDETVFGLRRLDQRDAKSLGQVDQRLANKNGEELLAVVGPAIEALFPDHGLKPGKTRGVSPEMALQLNPPPLDPWVFWTGAGLTGASALASAIVCAVWAQNETALSDFDKEAVATGAVKEAADRQRLTSAADAGLVGSSVALSATAALLLATAASALFVDWDGLRDGVHVEVQR